MNSTQEEPEMRTARILAVPGILLNFPASVRDPTPTAHHRIFSYQYPLPLAAIAIARQESYFFKDLSVFPGLMRKAQESN